METLVQLKYNLEHNEIIGTSFPTLQQLASIKVAFSLWSGEELIKQKNIAHKDRKYARHITLGSNNNATIGLSMKEPKSNWNISEKVNNVKEKMHCLSIPITLKDALEAKIEKVGDQLYIFKYDTYDQLTEVSVKKQIFDSTQKLSDLLSDVSFSSNWSHFQKMICWTSQCTIDKRKTHEAFAECKDLDVETRFKIAANFYLEKQINALAVQLPQNYLQEYKRPFCSVYEMEGAFLARQHFGIMRIVPNFKNCLIRDGLMNETACLYYWQHLNETQKEQVFMQYNIIEDICPNFSIFMFTQLSTEKKREILLTPNLTMRHRRGNLLCKLQSTQWYPVFRACIAEAQEVLNEVTIKNLLHYCSTICHEFACNKKYHAQILCALLKLLHENNPNMIGGIHWRTVASRITHVVAFWMNNGEMSLTKFVIERIESAWLKKWFLGLSKKKIEPFLTNTQHGILACIMDIAFQSFEEKWNLCIEGEIFNFIFNNLEDNCFNAVDEILKVLFPNDDDAKRYKKHFAEEMKGFQLCSIFLTHEKLECVIEFVQFCFESEKEIKNFYHKFVQNKEFTKLFT